MKKENQTKRRISLSDTYAANIKGISPEGTLSGGIRFLYDYYATTESNINKMVDALDNCKRSDQ